MSGSSASGEDTRHCLILFYSKDRFRVHGLPSSVEHGNFTVHLHPTLYTSEAKPMPQVDIVIFDIASKEEAVLAEAAIQKYSYVVNRWISFNWKYPLFDLALKYGLNAMGRRAMNHRRALGKQMAAIDQEFSKLSTSIAEALDSNKSGQIEYQDFHEVAGKVGIEVNDAQFEEILNVVNPGGHEGLSFRSVETFLRSGTTSEILTKVIGKVVTELKLTEGVSNLTARRFGLEKKGGIDTDVQLITGEPEFLPSSSFSINLTNQISEQESQVMHIGELLDVQKENYLVLSFKLRPELSEEVAREYFESLYLERQTTPQLLKRLGREYRKLNLIQLLASWKYRISNRRVYIFAFFSLPFLFGLVKKFDPITTFLDPSMMHLDIGLDFKSHADLDHLLADFPHAISTLLRQFKAEGRIHVCEKVVELVNLLIRYATTSASATAGTEYLGTFALLGKGRIEVKIPSEDVVSSPYISPIQVVIDELFSELPGLISSGLKSNLILDRINTFLSILDLSEIELRVGYKHLRLTLQTTIPGFLDRFQPPDFDLETLLKTLRSDVQDKERPEEAQKRSPEKKGLGMI